MVKKKKRMWFSSTIAVILIIFVTTVAVGIWRYGWEEVLDASLKYAIGATFTALLVAIVGYMFRKQISKALKKVMR